MIRKVAPDGPISAAHKPHVRIYVYRADGKMLALRRQKGDDESGNPPGTWETVTGGILGREQPWQSAWRELREETGYQRDDVTDFRQLTTYVFEVTLKPGVGEPDIDHNPDNEHDAWAWRDPAVILGWMGRRVAKAGLEGELAADRVLRAARLGDWDDLAKQLAPMLGEAASEGVLQGFEDLGLEDQDAFALANDDAIDFAADRAAELVGRRREGAVIHEVDQASPFAITDTTRDGLRAIVTQALEEGWSPAQLQAAVQDSALFGKTRAATIARTELAIAHTQGNLEAWRRSGVVQGKRAIVADTHDHDDECDGNAAAGVIPLDQAFPSGDDAPPFHPNCKCVVVPVTPASA